MTIKWVKTDPLVMNGEPFLYGTRLTVRQLLELRRNGYTLTALLKDHPELRRMGVAAAYAYAAEHRDRFGEFFEPDGSLAGPGYRPEEADGLPAREGMVGRDEDVQRLVVEGPLLEGGVGRGRHVGNDDDHGDVGVLGDEQVERPGRFGLAQVHAQGRVCAAQVIESLLDHPARSLPSRVEIRPSRPQK